MILNKETAQKTAELLLQINAIKLQPQDPFKWASGWLSPIYCDNRLTLSFPAIRNFLREHMANQIESVYGRPDIIAGVATGAIGIGVLVADYMNLPFCYVRPEAKKHGRKNRVEGLLEPNQNVVVVEDLISTGKSSLLATEAVQEAGGVVKGMAAIFTYGFDTAVENFKEAGISLHTLSDYNILLEQAEKSNYINRGDVKLLGQWRKDPQNWDPKMALENA